ncbi:hypothetical protein K439DRAFT_1614695 [Ramaria rubella]|nr:hypothetical protein K439DRAFT_1614695 [Ramaria rubella]
MPHTPRSRVDREVHPGMETRKAPKCQKKRGKVKCGATGQVAPPAQIASTSVIQGQFAAPTPGASSHDAVPETRESQPFSSLHSPSRQETLWDVRSPGSVGMHDPVPLATLNVDGPEESEDINRSPGPSHSPSPLPYLGDEEVFEGAPDQLEDVLWIYDMGAHPDGSESPPESTSDGEHPSEGAGHPSAMDVPQQTPAHILCPVNAFRAAHDRWWIRTILIFSIFVCCPGCHTSVTTHLIPQDESELSCASCGHNLYNGLPPNYFDLSWEAQKRLKKSPTPKVVIPMVLLSSLIADFLAHNGLENECKSWLSSESTPDIYTHIMDGKVWKTLVGPDGRPFFEAREDNELRIGTTASLNWFQAWQEDYSPSHSSGVFSFTVANLVTESKKHAIVHDDSRSMRANSGRTSTSDQLYDKGIVVKTPQFPEAVKMCGCTDTGHLVAPCTHCTVSQPDLFSDKFLMDGFPQRKYDKHVKRAWEWFIEALPREMLFTQFSGVVKNHWQSLRAGTAAKKHELDCVHEYLKDFEMPPHIAQPAKQVGETAGGALSADSWKGLAMVVLPCIIPFIWNKYCGPMQVEFVKAVQSYEDHLPKWEKYYGVAFREAAAVVRIRDIARIWLSVTPGIAPKGRKKVKKIPDPPKAPLLWMQKGEDIVFLNLATMVKIYVQHVITKAEIQQAHELMTVYLLEYKKFYGEGELKPNHHFTIHLGDHIRDYGPVYGFWCFLNERLNKLRKSFKCNNWGQGKLEVSMMRGWGRDIQLRDMICNVQVSPHNGENLVAQHMVKAASKAQGTVEDVVLSHEQAITDVVPHLVLVSPRCEATLAYYYNWGDTPIALPNKQVYLPLNAHVPRGSSYLACHASFYHYIVKEGQRITASLREGHQYRSLQSSLVKPNHHPRIFAEMQWFNTLRSVPISNVWASFPELDIQFHLLDFTGDIDYMAVPVSTIKCHIAWGQITETKHPQWFTISLDKACPVTC